MNVLIDTNVLLSAALRDKLPERVVLHVAGHDEFRWLVTPEILTEYTEVLRRPKFGLDEETLRALGRTARNADGERRQSADGARLSA